MKKKIRKSRKTLLKLIEAQPDASRALEVVQHGRPLLPIERKVKNYLRFPVSEINSSLRSNLATAILEAIDSRDVKSLRRVVDAVEQLSIPAREVHSCYANIVAMKGVLDDCKHSMTIPYLAKLLRVQKTDDGYKALRRLCIRLKFPIKEGKRGPIRE